MRSYYAGIRIRELRKVMQIFGPDVQFDISNGIFRTQVYNAETVLSPFIPCDFNYIRVQLDSSFVE
jgi:hypothetical protein